MEYGKWPSWVTQEAPRKPRLGAGGGKQGGQEGREVGEPGAGHRQRQTRFAAATIARYELSAQQIFGETNDLQRGPPPHLPLPLYKLQPLASTISHSLTLPFTSSLCLVLTALKAART